MQERLFMRKNLLTFFVVCCGIVAINIITAYKLVDNWSLAAVLFTMFLSVWLCALACMVIWAYFESKKKRYVAPIKKARHIYVSTIKKEFEPYVLKT
jgi:hypothetical protein